MTDAAPAPYRVLARKYRPTDFAGLIGQEAMVRTLSNAIRSGRLAHAFVLTGVRGIGKTTTARIIARALNCENGPTVAPCGICSHCRAIAEDRHVDVMEMDAASRTGVGDIRELIEGVRYRPASARFKIYIIDEVHMLSTAAFNALLKTLEEPPEHVKFVFATTEIRKIPVTVLSRCQRFDLRRVDMETLTAHFAGIAEKEGAEVAPEALRLIARAADGSVRDGLSLLDQAISHGDGRVDEHMARDMLGLADRAGTFDLFEQVMQGAIAPALDRLAEQYVLGADPVVVLQDLLELTHWLTRLKLAPDAAPEDLYSETERVRGREMATALSMPHLTRAWQMLLKGLSETRIAPNPAQAAEMALIRLAYAADLPSPAEAVAQLRDFAPKGGGAPAPGGGSPAVPMATATQTTTGGASGTRPTMAAGGSAALAVAPAAMAEPVSLPAMPANFTEIVALCVEHREAILAGQLRRDVALVRFEAGAIELRLLNEDRHRDLPGRLSQLLGQWTGRRWTVAVNSVDSAQPTLAEQEYDSERRRRADAAAHPLVAAIMAAFPGAGIEAIRDLAPEDETGDETDLGETAELLNAGEEDL